MKGANTEKGMFRIALEHALNWSNVVGDTGFEPVTSTVSKPLRAPLQGGKTPPVTAEPRTIIAPEQFDTLYWPPH